jgi:hypothetical protein
MNKENEAITPIVKIGTEFPCGTVTSIVNDGVNIETPEGVKKFSFNQIERFINDARTLSQA